MHTMYRLLFTVIAVLGAAGMAGQTVVVDSEDGGVIAGASVFSASGAVAGISGSDGRVPEQSIKSFPVTVRSLGYEPVTLTAPTDTVRLRSSFISLPEVAVNEKTRDVLRQVCYVREYLGITTGTDTTMIFAEYMVDYFIPRHKLKKYKFHDTPTVLCRRNYERFGNDSIAVNDPDAEALSFLQFATADSTRFDEIESLRNLAAGNDTVMGKYNVKRIIRKTDKGYYITHDMLADDKDHTLSPWIFKMLGLTMDMTDVLSTAGYNRNGTGRYGPEDMAFMSQTIRATARGKWFKKWLKTKDPIEISAYYEVYPIDYEYLTAEESKAMEKETRYLDHITVPPTAPALDNATAALVAHGEALKASMKGENEPAAD